jgi:protein ImuA
LLLPALAKAVQGGAGPFAVIGAPHEPFTPALAAGGLPVDSLLWIRAERAAELLWASSRRCAAPTSQPCWLGCHISSQENGGLSGLSS